MKFFESYNFVLIFFLFAQGVSCQNATGIRNNEGWSADIDALLSKIKKEHYVYRSKPLPDELIALAEKLKKSSAGFTHERMLIELERLMFYLGDGHSYILPFGARITQSHFLPLHFYAFSDGMFIIDAEEPYKKWIGYKVVQLGDVIPERFMKDMEHFISQDNSTGSKWIGPFFLRFRGMLESYGLPSGAPSVEMTVENASGTRQTEKILFIPVPRMRGIPKMMASQLPGAGAPPLYLSNIQDNFWLRYLPEQHTVYVQFNQVMNKENETLDNFSAALAKLLQENNPGTLIIDVRHNNGGNGELTWPFIEVLKKFAGERSKNLVLITGRNTFSAAQIFISRVAKEIPQVVFAGEPSSSSPNFVGEENGFELPWSGAIGSVSNRYHENIPGDTRKWIEPDIKIALSSKEYFGNNDPVMRAVFDHFQIKQY